MEKIAKIHSETFDYDMAKIREGDWPDDSEYMDVITLPISTPIEEMHQSVVKFIKYYNQLKP